MNEASKLRAEAHHLFGRLRLVADAAERRRMMQEIERLWDAAARSELAAEHTGEKPPGALADPVLPVSRTCSGEV